MTGRLPSLSYQFALSKDDGAPWVVTRVRLEEQLNRPYCATIDAATEVDGPNTDALLGCSAALEFVRGEEPTRSLCGVVSRIDFLGHEEHRLLVRFHIVPAFDILRLRTHSRIWQQTSVQDIVSEVLDVAFTDHERSHDFGGVQRGITPRDYCLQYRESDFAFVSRLLEEEGISYEFLHDAATLQETMVLRDANNQYGEISNTDGSPDIPIVLTNPSEIDVESIQRFEWIKELTTTSTLRRDYDWQAPRDLLTESATGTDDQDCERRVYSHGTRRYISDDLRQQASNRQESALQPAKRVKGCSNVSAMRPGLRMRVHGHDRSDLEREYLIIEVTHSGAERHVNADHDQAQAYSNQFVCVPYDSPVRPERQTPAPREYGPQTAIVTGPEQEEIHTDEHGRVQVQFYWQEEPSYAADSSCWIRCSQSWAGMGWGTQFIPRVGMEVVVQFLEGNPDRPLVTGCVYNAEFTPPFPLPDNKTQSGWRSNSSKGGEGFNELRFEDLAGEEEIYLHGQKDWNIEIENDENREVKHDRTKKVGNDERFEIVHDQIGKVGNDQTLEVVNNQSETIGANRTDSIGKDAFEDVKANKSVTVGEMMTVDVGGQMATTVEDASSLEVGASRTINIGEDATESVIGDKSVESSHMSFSSSKKFTVQAGDKVTVTGDKDIAVKAEDKITLTCGDASITLKSDGKILIKGGDVSIKGSGNVVIKGQKVSGN